MRTPHVEENLSCYAAKAPRRKRNPRSYAGLIGERMRSQTAIGFYAKAVSKEARVLDLIFVALTIVFFLIALAYVRGCEKLQ